MGDKDIRVALLCEYRITAFGIKTLLNAEEDISVDRSVSRFSGLYSLIEEQQPHVALIELSFLKSSGLSALKDITRNRPGIGLIVLSRNEREPFISKTMEHGALGYVSLDCEPVELVEAVRSVSLGRRFLSQDIAYDFAISRLENKDDLLSSLTGREYEVLTHLAKGNSVNEVAPLLHLSPKTIHVYRANLLTKLNASNNSELTLIALRLGVVSLDAADER